MVKVRMQEFLVPSPMVPLLTLHFQLILKAPMQCVHLHDTQVSGVIGCSFVTR